MSKKLIVLAVLAIILFGVGALAACTPEEDEIVAKGTLYSFQEAYDEGLLTVENFRVL